MEQRSGFGGSITTPFLQWTWDQQVGAVLVGAVIETFLIWSPITAIQQEVDRGDRASFWHLCIV